MFRPTCVVYGLFLSLAVVLTACTPRSVREVQNVVTEADSLWRNGQMYGIDKGDSATLAEAYQRLDRVQAIFPDEFAHSCYHYGRLLRKKDNPAEAMQAFLNATHSRTRDYHILGRVYSNMGDICHLAGEFDLAYDMYEKSSEMYLRNGDTLLYYYDINNMAFALAEQGNIPNTNLLLDSIQKFNDQAIISKSLETRALLYLRCEEYEKAIQAIDSMLSNGIYDLFYFLMKAQAFEHLNKMDSAIAYAHLISQSTSNNRFLIPAYYILLHDNNTLTHDSILSLTYKRADAQKEWAVQNGYYANAVLLLQQDLNKKYDWRWLYSILAGILFMIALTLLCHIWRKRKHHQQIIQDIRNKELQKSALAKNIDDLSQMQEIHYNAIIEDIDNLCLSIHTNKDIKDFLHWNNYLEMCELADHYMYNIVSRLHEYNLSEKETRLCILILLKVSTLQMVELLPYAQSGLGKFKYTTARKLGTNTADMRSFILKMVSSPCR